MAVSREYSSGRPQQPERNHRPARRAAGGIGHFFAVFFKVLGTLLLIGVTTGALLACFAAAYVQGVIVPQADMNLYDFSDDMSLSSTMYYTDKQTGALVELGSIYGEENRVWLRYDQIPEDLVNATIAIEDKRFLTHHGVDWIRTARGVINLFTGQDVQGGSTITQQLVKNITTENDVTVQRKILEIFRALDLEKKYDKSKIMEWYLNYIYLGEHCYGVYTASYAYFGKDVSQLSLAECASLISITNNPSKFNPYRSGVDENGNTDPDWGRKNNARRATQTIENMWEFGMISEEEYNEAKRQLKQGLTFARGKAEKVQEVAYTWYEDQVISDVIQDLVDRNGMSEKLATDLIYYGGLSIETCLDPGVQAVVDEVYQNMENLPYTSSSGQQLQSAIVIVDPSGNIVALSGGMGEKEGSRIWSRATDTKRAPGSAFKPLSVYARALDIGLITPGSVYDDSPYQLLGGEAYPSNSYHSYLGRMTIREGVYRSSNCIAIKVLADLTPEESFDFLTSRLGFDLVRERVSSTGYVSTDVALAPLSMGGLTDGVSVRDMATAYSIFPRGGSYVDSRTYTVVRDSRGNVVLDNTQRIPVPAVKETTAYYINSMLQDVVNLGYSTHGATGYEAKFDGMTIAGKTGSTNSNRDRWFVGYTPYYTAAVWTGYDQQERITSKGNPAAQLWNQVMSRLHEGLEDKSFPQPDGLVSVSICRDSGMRAGDACQMDPRGPRVKTESYFPEDVPTQYCTVHNLEPYPEGSQVTICLEDPILDANGQPVSCLYHLAGEFCPEESKSTVSLMDLTRERVSQNYAIRDDLYTTEYYKGLGEAAACTLHTEAEPYDPLTFDPEDETTWPTEEQWPGFDILDPSTWPGAENQVYDPLTFDPEDETTWPTQSQWPGFDILDPSTWPTITIPTTEPTPPVGEDPSPSPGGEEPIPTTPIPPEPSESSEPTPSGPSPSGSGEEPTAPPSSPPPSDGGFGDFWGP